MKSIKQIKAKGFAVKIINLCRFLREQKKEFLISKQIMRSGTSIGANLYEAEQAQSKEDFVHKNSISLKEANEKMYWLELLYETDYISAEKFDECRIDCEELIKMLVSSIKTTKNRLGK
ncbi:MAG: four helix bundle protein [Firmicutes bacterium]|nr:four helix bundle protein [Bacillota bacterium]